MSTSCRIQTKKPSVFKTLEKSIAFFACKHEDLGEDASVNINKELKVSLVQLRESLVMIVEVAKIN